MKNKKGFTLLELLVVVLIIGILAAIALPQYRKSVEKAKLAEALMNLKSLEGSIERYILANGFPDNQIFLKDIPLDVELSGGEYSEENYTYFIKDFEYFATCYSGRCIMQVYRLPYEYELYSEITQSNKFHSCATTGTNKGEYICHYLESQGWQYTDGEI